jgi:hypothetical protein
MDGIAERLIDVPANIRMKGNHLADGHVVLPEQANLWIGRRVPLVPVIREE